jgi:hypothetical protein
MAASPANRGDIPSALVSGLPMLLALDWRQCSIELNAAAPPAGRSADEIDLR